MNIKAFTEKEPEEELEEQKKIKRKKPQPLADIDWEPVIDACKEYNDKK